MNLCMLDWSDINLDDGSLLVRYGKGKKYRVVGVGFKVRRLLLRYKSQLGNQKTESEKPLIQTING
jgi:integrase